MVSKVIWVALAVILIVVIMNPPKFDRSPEVTDEPPTVAVTIHPNTVAKPIVAVPGALVCANVEEIKAVADMYNEHWGETQQDAMSGGKSVLLRGQSVPAPDPRVYGCYLLPPGTPIQAENSPLGNMTVGGYLWATAKLSDGTIAHGLTPSNMLAAQ